MPQICHLMYADLAQGRDRAGIAELEMQLAPPDQKEEKMGEMNRIAMQALPGGMAPPPPGAPRKKRKKRAEP